MIGSHFCSLASSRTKEHKGEALAVLVPLKEEKIDS